MCVARLTEIHRYKSIVAWYVAINHLELNHKDNTDYTFKSSTEL
jgi:hypothetical protein